MVLHIGRKFWSPHFLGIYVPWNLENIRKSTNNLSFLCQFFINEITASDAGPDIIRSHLFLFQKTSAFRIRACYTHFRTGWKFFRYYSYMRFYHKLDVKVNLIFIIISKPIILIKWDVKVLDIMECSEK